MSILSPIVRPLPEDMGRNKAGHRTMRPAHFALLVLVLPGLLALRPVTTFAQPGPSTGGRLVFVSDRSGEETIWSMLPDGSNPLQLTTQPPRGMGDQAPDLSRDCRQVAFTTTGSAVGRSPP